MVRRPTRKRKRNPKGKDQAPSLEVESNDQQPIEKAQLERYPSKLGNKHRSDRQRVTRQENRKPVHETSAYLTNESLRRRK